MRQGWQRRMFVPSAPVMIAPAMLLPDSDINKNTSSTTTYNNDDATNTSTSTSTSTTTNNNDINNNNSNNNIPRQWPCSSTDSSRWEGSGEASLSSDDDC